MSVRKIDPSPVAPEAMADYLVWAVKADDFSLGYHLATVADELTERARKEDDDDQRERLTAAAAKLNAQAVAVSSGMRREGGRP